MGSISMTKGISGRQDARASESESGVALIMALLALLLLTAVGLTLATSTSTEVQVAANYRWSMQALYNAEAGMELAKNIMVGADWTVHPWARQVASWDPTGTPATTWTVNTLAGATPTATQVGEPGRAGPVKPDGTIGTVTRDFEMGKCDQVGNGMGYGVVMPDLRGTSNALENVSVYPLPNVSGGKSLNGAFTLWYRKPPMFTQDGTGKVRDFGFDQADRNFADVVIVVSEGVAPFQAGNAVAGFAAAHQAVQIVEATLYGPPTIPVCEAELSPQAGSGPGGAGVDPCAQAAASFDITKMGVTVTGTGTATRHAY